MKYLGIAAHTSRSRSRTQSRSHAYLLFVLTHRFSKKGETARNLGLTGKKCYIVYNPPNIFARSLTTEYLGAITGEDGVIFLNFLNCVRYENIFQGCKRDAQIIIRVHYLILEARNLPRTKVKEDSSSKQIIFDYKYPSLVYTTQVNSTFRAR